MSTEIAELSEDALVEKYFKERGFEMMVGPPPNDAEIPYFLLQEPQIYMCRSSMEFYYTSYGSNTMCVGQCHPSLFPAEKLVSLMIEMASFLHKDKNQLVVHPEAGRKFPVYVADPAWVPVVDMLVKKYNV